MYMQQSEWTINCTVNGNSPIAHPKQPARLSASRTIYRFGLSSKNASPSLHTPSYKVILSNKMV